MKSVTVFGWSDFFTISFLSFLTSFSYVWQDKYQTLKTVFGKLFEAFQNSVLSVLRYASYLQLSLGICNSGQSWSFVFDLSSGQYVSFVISRYTSKNGTVYAITLQWPFTGVFTLGAPISTENTQVTMLGYEGKFAWKPATDKGGLIVTVPCIPTNKLKSKWTWVFKLEYVH